MIISIKYIFAILFTILSSSLYVYTMTGESQQYGNVLYSVFTGILITYIIYIKTIQVGTKMLEKYYNRNK
jgi:hypothetical protein